MRRGKPDSFLWWSFPSWDLNVPWNWMQWTDKNSPTEYPAGKHASCHLSKSKLRSETSSNGVYWGMSSDLKRWAGVQKMCWEYKEISYMYNHPWRNFILIYNKLGICISVHCIYKIAHTGNKSINDKILLLQISIFHCFLVS